MKANVCCAAEKVHKNTKSMDIYRRMYTKPSEIPSSEPGTPLLTKVRILAQLSWQMVGSS